MNGKYPAKLPTVLAAAAVSWGWLVAPSSVSADFVELDQQLRIQQQRSRFELMLEQVEESARRRAATSRAMPAGRAAPTPVDLGEATESPRLDTLIVTDPPGADEQMQSEPRLRADQAYERDQRRILDHRQQRDALVAGPRASGPAVDDGYASKRGNLTRYKTQNNRLTLQRKLRR